MEHTILPVLPVAGHHDRVAVPKGCAAETCRAAGDAEVSQ